MQSDTDLIKTHFQIYIYRVRGRQSKDFRIINGMREGAAASPVLWSVYADGVLKLLRKSGLGCYIAGVWVGAVMYADDLALLAPTRAILASMLSLVVTHGAELNLTFSSCQEPSKCKSFCIYFTKQQGRKVKYPAPLTLNGVQLPWRERAVHLGHTLHQETNMDRDSKRARARFIDRTVEIREELFFAKPEQVMKAVQILSTDSYGSMLWSLNSAGAESFFKAWNTCVKLVYGVPRSTFTYLVQIMGRGRVNMLDEHFLVFQIIFTLCEGFSTKPGRMLKKGRKY